MGLIFPEKNVKTIQVFIALILFSSLAYGQEIVSYNLDVKVNVVLKKLQVNGSIDIDFKNKDSISLILWENSDIHSISSNQAQVRYYFDSISPSPVMYIPNGRNLIVYKPTKSIEKQSILFNYDCDMHNLNGWASSFSENWIEINYYSAWFPLNNNSRNFTSKLTITIDDKYIVTGSGIVNKKEDHWEMIQPWTGFDNVIIASKNLKSKVLHENNVYVETDYSEFPESDADSVISECKYILDLYKNLYGAKDSTYLKFIIAPFEQGGGYSRKNFVSMRTKQFSFYTRGGIAHEMAHFWWSDANTTTWEDWLNEAFAEYSMLIYFRERLGLDVFNEQIKEYKNRTLNTPPIWGIKRDARESYTVLYEKGALILNELEQKLGQDQFFSFLKVVVNNKIKTTDELLDLIEMKLSRGIREWFENKIKTA
jgi:hypothetical protein